MFGVDAERRGPLKGRLKHLNVLGLPGLNVGRGVRIAYSAEQVAQWLVALLLEECGIDPTVAVKLIQAAWDREVDMSPARGRPWTGKMSRTGRGTTSS